MGEPLELVVLGAGAALPAPGRGPAGYALRGGGLDGLTLFDCGPGSVRSLADHGLALLDVRRVVVSHFHTDHVLDLFHLAFARRSPFLPGPVPELELIGPDGLEDLVYGATGPLDSWSRDAAHRILEVSPGLTGDAAVLGRHDGTLTHGRARHTEEALSWRLDAPSGASVVYSGDTGETPALAELVGRRGGADLLVAECALSPDADPAAHLHGGAAGRAARDGRARALLLSHFYPDVDPEEARAAAAEVYGGPIFLAVDGTRLVVEPGAVRTGSR